nr:hypothetical protein [Tanacetum cinerariifolium]
DLIPRTPEESEEESNDEEEQELRLSEEARIKEEEDTDELYCDVNINQGRGLQERLRSLETSFSKYRQTNQFADAVSLILGIVQQYMDQQMKEAVREAVQIQTERLQYSLQRENDEFLRNIDENMKKVLKGLVRIMLRNKYHDPSLDQTGGLKDKKKEVSMHQLALHLKKLPGVKAELPKGFNLNKCLPHLEWFSQPRKPPSPDRAWNTT